MQHINEHIESGSQRITKLAHACLFEEARLHIIEFNTCLNVDKADEEPQASERSAAPYGKARAK